MHGENLSSLAAACWLCAAVGTPPGSRCRQVWSAEMYCSDMRSRPADAGEPSFPPCAKSTVICPLLLGSGKSGTPCERMQATYAKAARTLAVLLPPLTAAGENAVAVVVVEPMLATPDECESPHAALSRPAPARTSTTTASRRGNSAIDLIADFVFVSEANSTNHLYATDGDDGVTGLKANDPVGATSKGTCQADQNV